MEHHIQDNLVLTKIKSNLLNSPGIWLATLSNET